MQQRKKQRSATHAEAEYGLDGPVITLKEFMDREGTDDPKKWTHTPHCADCGEPKYAYDKKGARASDQTGVSGFHAVRNEVTKPRIGPGFNHYPPKDANSPVLDCPAYVRDDSRFQTPNMRELIDNNVFHRNERKRNEFALDEPETAKRNDALRGYLMQRLMGSPEIPETDQKEIKKIRRGLITVAGLAEHTWILPYAEMLALDPKEREFTSRRGGKEPETWVNRVRFGTEGKQNLPVTYADGEKGVLVFPEFLVPGFVGKRGRFKAWENPGTGEKVRIPISKEFADTQIKRILDRQEADELRRRAAQESTQRNPVLEFSQTPLIVPATSTAAIIQASAFAASPPLIVKPAGDGNTVVAVPPPPAPAVSGIPPVAAVKPGMTLELDFDQPVPLNVRSETPSADTGMGTGKPKQLRLGLTA